MGNDALGVRVGVGVQRVARQRFAGGGIHPQDRTIQSDRVATGAQILAPEPPTFRCWRSKRRPDPPGRVSTRVYRVTLLSVVGKVEARSVPTTDVEGAILAKGQITYGVARILRAPVVYEHLLGAGHLVAARLQAREPPTDHAPVSG